MSEDDAQLIGKVVGRYRLVEPLGSGGVASVFRAEHVESRAEVAVKVLRSDMLDKSLVGRFGREAIAMSRLEHPNVVKVIDSGTEGDLPYIVIEYVRGKSVSEVLREDGPMSPKRAARIARAVASGLDEAHCLGFVHRDVKPSNVMLSPGPDGRDVVKLLDFGIVSLAQTSLNPRLTGQGVVIGTPKYMSPEQASGEDPQLPADLYSLGLVLFEMLAGRPAFEGNSVSQILIKQISEAPPDLPPCGGLEALVSRLLEKLPDDRPASADEVVRELDRIEPAVPETPLVVERADSADAHAETLPAGVGEDTGRLQTLDIPQMDEAALAEPVVKTISFEQSWEEISGEEKRPKVTFSNAFVMALLGVVVLLLGVIFVLLR